jgi:hypothetical protein
MWPGGYTWSTGLYGVAHACYDIYKILLSLFLLYNTPTTSWKIKFKTYFTPLKLGLSLYGHPVKGTWRGSSFAGDPEDYVEEGSGDGHLSLGTPLGNLEGGSFTGDFERWMRRVSFSIGSHWGTWGGGSVYLELWEFAEGGLWLWSISLYGSSVRGTQRGGGAHLLQALKVM